MIIDETNIFSEDQTLTASAASTNVIDLGVARDIGKGVPIPIVIQLTNDATGTTPTMKAAIQVSVDEAFSAPITVAESEVLTSPKAGDRVSLNYIPRGTDKRYARVYYTLGGTTPSMDVTAGVVASHQDN
ncbi:MAG: hypothetical protein DSZ27_08405 [Thiomicrospira sp.]|nr:MAG: hypothetical protein DSZ27_08405 [Thiomicrospira sp.]